MNKQETLEEATEEAKQRAENYMRLKGALEPKQKTIEDSIYQAIGKFAEIRYLERLDNFQKCDFKDGVFEGAKWQADRMYSEEEVKEILMKTDRFLRADLDLWFEQFKKK
jgi:hypothetical protein